MTFTQFFGDFVALNVDRPSFIRVGQAFYNYLNTARPDLADKIVGTPLDPFYRDDVPVETLDFLMTNW